MLKNNPEKRAMNKQGIQEGLKEQTDHTNTLLERKNESLRVDVMNLEKKNIRLKEVMIVRKYRFSLPRFKNIGKLLFRYWVNTQF